MRLQVIDIQKHDEIDPVSGSKRPISAYLLLESLGGSRIEVSTLHGYGEDQLVNPWVGTRRYFNGIFIARPVRSVSVEELKMAQRLHGNNIWGIEANTSLPEEQRERLIAHIEGGDGRPREAGAHALTASPVRPQTAHAKLAFQEIDQLASLCESPLLPAPGGFMDVELSPGLEASIRAADEAHFKIAVANDPILLDNQVARAMARVGIHIDALVSKARVEMFAATRKGERPIERKGLWVIC